MNLIIDVGNTRVKVAVFESGKILEVFVFQKEKLLENLNKILQDFSVEHTIVSSVASFTDKEIEKIDQLLSPLFLNSETKVPFKNNYDTPKTLGVDRIALAAAAVDQYPNENVLVIDAGTCITYEFITKNKEYLGGAISPGIKMRYNALHTFTSNLPLLKSSQINSFIGTNTNNSIHSGVVNGVYNEIKGLINQYTSEFQDLTVVLTGGDTKFLEEQLKSVIFAQPNFILEGLHTILIYNLADD
ncbi:type III pantothenate kinase [Tenacibaculum sp. MAR_2009_124]|uniref:type III pantothenate kinase n=1 Tax=Tenacibaculum sp. MAR_2009_124 TaxID=1250059 RepID=UPI0008998BE0|nr:type III pantothenate kinase [Tenacibaculum sp. MAR_2009_124]SEC80411.1 type III pantothenate kinase [Tenacibaculum sp. MAR_2009_124]